MMIDTTLKTLLREWTDLDIAAYGLGLSIGMFDIDNPEHLFATGVKWVIETDNPISRILYDTLDRLAKEGVLEKDEDMRYRWANQDIKVLADKD